MKNTINLYKIALFSAIFLIVAVLALSHNANACDYYDSYCYDNTIYYPVYYPNYPDQGPTYVFDRYNYNYDNYDYRYNYNYYRPITVSCSVNTSSVYTGDNVTWSAYASGGNGSYSYSWSGTDNLSGYGSYISKTYYNTGTKTAYVTVTSGGQSVSQNCSNSVYVNNRTYYYNPAPTPVYSYGYVNSNNSGLDIACYSDPSTITANQPVNWTAEVVGGIAPYKYSWTGSDGLTGDQKTVIKYYSTAGSKNAIITVTSADGKTATKACSNTLAVRSTTSTVARTTTNTSTVSTNKTSQTASVANATNNTCDNTASKNGALTAASLFSLSNIPWGWVAVLVIAVLFATVLYLLFNRNKI